MKSDLIILKGIYAICRLDNDSEMPTWLNKSDFYSLTRTRDELSIVCKQSAMEQDEKLIIDNDWSIFKVSCPLDLSLTGIIAGISGVLGKNIIPLFTISTYETYYILVKEENLDKAISALKKNGYRISFEQ